jgi:H+/Cl- antiporter ClcA
MKLILKLRGYLKRSFDRIRNERLKANLLLAIPYWIASLLTGLAAVIYAKLFSLAEHGAIYFFHNRLWLLFFVTPLCFLVARGLVYKYAPYSRGSGIPQVMAAIEFARPAGNRKVNKLLGLRIILIKVLSSLTMVFGGGVVGREGPTIQIAGSVFRKINQWLPGWWPKISKRNMIMTGAAAGLAAAFNTPLGGIVFAVEELTKTHISYFKTAIFTSVIIAGLTAQAFLGPYLYLGFPNVSPLSGFIFLGVILVAAISGIAGSAMAKIILSVFRWKASFKFSYQHVIFLVVSAWLVVSLAFFVDERTLGSGKEIMTTALFTQQKYLPWYLPLLRMAGPVLSFCTGAAGGVFAPALAAGASIGSFFSGWMHLTDANTNLLILSGMVAFLTGVTRTPFTSAILVLEMTDRHNMIFYLMLSGLVSSLTAFLIDKKSFYDHLKRYYIEQLNKEDEPDPSPVRVSPES